MKIHIDGKKFTTKPEKADIAGIKWRFTKPGSIHDLTVAQIAKALTRGHTIEPGVCPYSTQTKAKDKNGTSDADFVEQTLFMVDIDNKLTDIPRTTPAQALEALAEYNLPLAFAYPTFHSTDEQERFRIALVSDEVFTDRTERDRVQAALIRLFPQSDKGCENADRIFFGTDKPLYEGIGDLNAVCRKADLLSFADRLIADEAAADKPKFGEVIPEGKRHNTLLSFANTVLKKYGETDKAFELFLQRAEQCEGAMPEAELRAIWRDAGRYYNTVISTAPAYVQPEQYEGSAQADFDEPKKKKRRTPISYYTELARKFMSEHTYVVGVQALAKGGFGNDTLYEYSNGVWLPHSETDVKHILARRVISAGVTPDPEQVNKAYKLVLMSGERRNVDTFNPDENLVCFRNGVYRLSDGARLEHSPDYYFSLQLNANIPDTVQETPYCDLCLSNFGGTNIQRLLLQISGGCMSNVRMPRFKKGVLQYGKGNTGKTQLKQLVERILGSGNFNNVDLSDIEGNRFIMAAFEHVRVGGSNDMSNVRVKELKAFKLLTGGDNIQAENKGEKGFTFSYKGILWFLANSLPLFGGDKGEHVYDRWILIPCEHPVPADKQIKDLVDKMFAERDSFCMKALQAFQQAVTNNYTFDIPAECEYANREYRVKNSSLRMFLDECCEPLGVEVKGKTTTGKFWDAFKEWCKDANVHMPSKGEFRREFAAIVGVDEKDLDRHTKDGNFYPYVLTAQAAKELCPWDAFLLS